jgi:outer membrane biosynthesis protein TonB
MKTFSSFAAMLGFALPQVQAEPAATLPLVPPNYNCPPANYPMLSLREQAQGTVELKLTVGEASRI